MDDEAILRWRTAVPVRAGSILILRLAGVAPGESPVTGRFDFDGRASLPFSFAPGPGDIEVRLPPLSEEIASEAVVTVGVVIDNPRAPSEAGIIAADTRRLGVLLRTVAIEPPH